MLRDVGRKGVPKLFYEQKRVEGGRRGGKKTEHCQKRERGGEIATGTLRTVADKIITIAGKKRVGKKMKTRSALTKPLEGRDERNYVIWAQISDRVAGARKKGGCTESKAVG